jgi:DHA1 family bicyclomycin/chloramphenicol resistance-like MFS transporter
VLLLGAAGDGPRGAASALVGALQLAAASLAAFAVGAFHDGTAWPLAVTIAGMTGAAAAAYCALRPPRAVAE